MTQRMVALMQESPGSRFFFAVGAGHLGGKRGIVQQLRDQQIQVERATD